MIPFLFFYTLFLLLNGTSCSCLNIREKSLSLSSNTLNFIHRDIKIQADQVPILRSGDPFFNHRQRKRNEYFQAYSTFKWLLAEAARENNTPMIRSYLYILYNKVPVLLHVDTLFEDKIHGALGLLHYAVLYNNLELLDLLGNGYGASLELRNSSSQTVLALAVSLHRFDCIKELVSQGARIDYHVGEFPSLLHYAASFNLHVIIEEMRLAGHSLSDSYCDGWKTLDTPLEVAIQNESFKSAMILRDYNASCCSNKINRMLKKAYDNNVWTQIEFIETFFLLRHE